MDGSPLEISILVWCFVQHLDNKYDKMETCIGVIVAYLPKETIIDKVEQSGSPIDLFHCVFVDCNSCEDTSRFQGADFLNPKNNFKWIPQEVAFQVAKYGVTNRPVYWQDKLHIKACARWNMYRVAKAKVSTLTKRTKALAGTGKAGHKKPTRLSSRKKKVVESNDSEYNPSSTSSYIIVFHHIKHRRVRHLSLSHTSFRSLLISASVLISSIPKLCLNPLL